VQVDVVVAAVVVVVDEDNTVAAEIRMRRHWEGYHCCGGCGAVVAVEEDVVDVGSLSSLVADKAYATRLRTPTLCIRCPLFVSHHPATQKGIPISTLLGSADAGGILQPPIFVPISFGGDILAMKEDIQWRSLVGRREVRIGRLRDESPTSVEHLEGAYPPSIGRISGPKDVLPTIILLKERTDPSPFV